MECSDSTTHLTNKHVQYPWIGKNRFFLTNTQIEGTLFWLPIFLRKKNFQHWLIDQDRYSNQKKKTTKILRLFEENSRSWTFLFCYFFSKQKKTKQQKSSFLFLLLFTTIIVSADREREVIVIFIVVVVVLVVVDRFFVVVLLFGLF